MSAFEAELVGPVERAIRDLEEREQIARTEVSLLYSALEREPHRAEEHVRTIAGVKLELETSIAARAALAGKLDAMRAALEEAKQDGRLARIEELMRSLDDKDAREVIRAKACDAAAMLGKLRPEAREADQALTVRWQELASMMTKLGLAPPPRPSTSAFVVARTALLEELRKRGATLSDFRV